MNLERKLQPLLLSLLIISVVSTSIHYTDNFLLFEKYPQPEWITLPSIYISWIILTAIGFAGYWLYRNKRFWLAYVCLLIYSLTGLSSLGHYFYGAMSEFSGKMHFFIWTDGLTGLAVLGFTSWSGLISKVLRIKV
jgi:hypothetical protein